jgi:hypothetical protein
LDAVAFLKDFHDHLACRLDTYEQAIYLYVIRHSRLIGDSEVVIGFKSARKELALGIGKAGSPMSEHVCYEKLRSLEQKGCLKILGSERAGTRVHALLPEELGILRPDTPPPAIDLELLDFFNVPENRLLILKREAHRCFYCMCALNGDNHVVEHVVSRPEGTNSYRNVVASCRRCNNRKGESLAKDFLRTLYRESFLDADDFENRISHLERLQAGELRPELAG